MSRSTLETEKVSFDTTPVELNVDVDPRWKLVERIAASPAFQRSKRVRDFLLFVCERALQHPGAPIREPEIRKAVFGRSADPNDPEDTLVRVQASQLRKRLQAYFVGEGADEPMVIEVPKGSYLPVFKERRIEPPAPPPAEVPAPPPPVRRPWGRLTAAAAFVLLAALCTFLYVDREQLRRKELAHPLNAQPSVARLWGQMFGEKRVYVVLSDANLTMFQDLLQYQLTLSEYQRHRFSALAAERLTDKNARDWAMQLMYREFTGIADTNLARRVVNVNTLQGRTSDVVLSRHADAGQIRSQNLVLSGSRRSNPWLELFEPQLNFRSRFEESGRRAYLDNTAPRPGEEASYRVVWNHVGYCRVAYLPNMDRTGSVLVVSGSDMTSSDAGAEFITHERSVRHLLEVLGVGPNQRIPYFEVLLRAQLLLGTAANFELIAHRVVAP